MLKMTWRGLYLSSKFMKNRFYLPIYFQWTQNLHRRSKTRTETVSGDYQWSRGSVITPAAVQLSKSNNIFKTPEHVRKCTESGLQIFILCADARKCISQVYLERCAGQATGANSRKCIASVLQVYRRYVSTVPQLPHRRWALATLQWVANTRS